MTSKELLFLKIFFILQYIVETFYFCMIYYACLYVQIYLSNSDYYSHVKQESNGMVFFFLEPFLRTFCTLILTTRFMRFLKLLLWFHLHFYPYLSSSFYSLVFIRLFFTSLLHSFLFSLFLTTIARLISPTPPPLLSQGIYPSISSPGPIF